MILHFYVNGTEYNLETEPDKRLIDIVRGDLHLTGTKEGCGEGECGACTVLMDGEPVHACLCIALQLQETHIETIESLSSDGKMDILQKCFVEELAVQCGFCTPGMIMSAKALLRKVPDPTEEEIRSALSGNICRCSAYSQIVKAVQRASLEMRRGS